MDPQADSDEEFIVLSASDCTESASALFPQAAGLKSSAELFVKSIGLLPSLLGARVTEFQASGTTRTYTQKYSETMGRQIVDQRSVTNYYISGGRGGSGGEGGDKGGDGGTGQGPTVHFGQPQEREPSKFQRIRLGDIKLIKEFKEMRSSPRWSVVGHQTSGASVRRVYKAKLEGRESGHLTVTMYEGDRAEEEWNQDLANYESIRHPNIMQLYGLVSSKGLYAMVFHDELIPFAQFLRRFEHSPILRTYILGYCLIIKGTEHEEAASYISDVFPMSPIRDYDNLTVWVRAQTGELCLDLAQGGSGMAINFAWWRDSRVLRLEILTLDAPDLEDIIISSLGEDQFHQLCSGYPITQLQYFQVSTEHLVGPGVFWLDSQCGTCVRITEPLQILPEEELKWYNYENAPDELLPSSWIRYDFPRRFALPLELNLWFPSLQIRKAWLAQANRIFAELQKPEHVEDYVCIDRVCFMLQIADERDIPDGYLLVCPPRDFRTGTEPHSNLYQWPACPVYWSLDPSGADRLSTEDARILGFPAIHIETRIDGFSWDRSVYKGLRRFHEGKGHDPESREVARRLGYPLYEVLRDRVPFPAREVNDEPYPWRFAGRRLNILDEDALDGDIPLVRDVAEDLDDLERDGFALGDDGVHHAGYTPTCTDCAAPKVPRPARPNPTQAGLLAG
ncbi:hypothetical protein MSAN_01508600 [Mycena sanguinolenta]|uniref:Protein kinase domain-containing protein n=1 Tax=Mycena sanguinolenta TaxID=230812 RepID=A0A8H6Y7D9_9AGAR|nr:hypothetical protein MSAN_01508600 [Mycena sanguinolenta]